jgi:hypothetical protein
MERHVGSHLSSDCTAIGVRRADRSVLDCVRQLTDVEMTASGRVCLLDFLRTELPLLCGLLPEDCAGASDGSV